MDGFLTLAGQLFLIVCIQSVLDVLASDRKYTPLQKMISVGCYVASLVLVLRFMQTHLFHLIQSMSRVF